MDKKFIDGAVNGIASLVMSLARKLKQRHSGQLNHYALTMTTGVILALVLMTSVLLI